MGLDQRHYFIILKLAVGLFLWIFNFRPWKNEVLISYIADLCCQLPSTTSRHLLCFIHQYYINIRTKKINSFLRDDSNLYWWMKHSKWRDVVLGNWQHRSAMYEIRTSFFHGRKLKIQRNKPTANFKIIK
jgi:hypothetical protein